MTEALVGLITS